MIFLKDEDKNYKEEVYNFVIVLPVWKDDTIWQKVVLRSMCVENSVPNKQLNI